MGTFLAHVVLYTVGIVGAAVITATRCGWLDDSPWLWVGVGCAVICVLCGGYIDVVRRRKKLEEVFE